MASLDLLFLLILLHLITGLTLASFACPYKLLESAFKVQVDLERKDDGEMIKLCSEREKTFVSNLLQKGIEKASHQLARNINLKSFTSFGASVCKAPTAKAKTSPRRQLATFGEPDNDERSLRSRTQFFRYYGTMRCRLCEKDSNDASKMKVGKYDESMMRKYDKVNRAYLGQISFSDQKSLQKIKVEFPLFGLQNRQDVIVTINGQYKFNLRRNQFRKVPLKKRMDDGFGWKITPLNKSRNYKVTLEINGIQYQQYPLWTNIVKKHALDVRVSFGGGRKLKIPKINAFTARYVAWTMSNYNGMCYIYPVASSPNHKRRRVVPFSSPVESPSSPTTPAMSPVLSPQPKRRRLTIIERTKTRQRKKYANGGSGTQSVSENMGFKIRVYRTLMCGLNQDLNHLLPVGHCMYGKGIHATVQLTPKPQWEKKLPTCRRV